MRVVTVGNGTPDASAGGYGVVWDGLVRALSVRGHDVAVLHPPALPSAGGLWTFNSAYTRCRTLEHVALARTEVARRGGAPGRRRPPRRGS